ATKAGSNLIQLLKSILFQSIYIFSPRVFNYEGFSDATILLPGRVDISRTHCEEKCNVISGEVKYSEKYIVKYSEVQGRHREKYISV
ncbi:hypothetical protein ALC53_01254, partial [Atta colombica]